MWKRLCVFFFIWFVYVGMCSPLSLHDISFAYGMTQPIYAESAIKHQQTKPNFQCFETFG